MKNFENLIMGIIGGLIVSEIIRQYEPKIAYIVYVCIFIFLFINFYIYWKNRIKIKFIRQNFNNRPYFLQFEAVNLGEKRNSLSEYIDLQCFLPAYPNKKIPNGINFKCKFNIPQEQRLLEPHKPVTIIASCDSDNQRLLFSWFRKYTFKPAKGMYTVKYVRNASDNGISKWRYEIEVFLYRWFKIVKTEDTFEVE